MSDRPAPAPPGARPSRAGALADLAFAVTDARPQPFAAVPTVLFRLALTRTSGGPVRSVSLTTAVRIAVAGRRYDPRAQLAMAELFGTPERWATTLHPLAWTQATTVVPAFDETTTVDLPVPVTTDVELAVTKYFHAVREGDVPLDFLFSGTVFHTGPDGRLRTTQISWAKDTTYRLPARVWHDLIDRYHAGGTWLRLSGDVHDRLSAYRTRHALGDWNETIRDLLDEAQGATA
ncbi:DUF6084 family protein [Streptomyces sp. ACA25]|uniref:DUF6084 family protein n=1 Tax=Streptomyces sp. ACA25 TaxID=3022596 RepID=UPI002308016D|nr:DUF6084 family protein [Streptomyces sp. ACA25]MDB1088532.1 DUF6084 family protein [Streptomyces sp. ACA25]